MIVRVTPHLAPPSPRQRAFEPAVGELLHDAHAPSVRPARVVVVNDREPASNGRRPELQIDRRQSRIVARRTAGAPARRVTVANDPRVQSMIARRARAAAAAGVFGSARMFFGALDLYVAPYRRVETGAPTSTS